MEECTYAFPLYDGVSIISFTCEMGSSSVKGVVKGKAEARRVYNDAKERGETAGLLEQGPTSDAFVVSLRNIAAGGKLDVTICYVGELKHDMGLGGIRYTLPTYINPRYGDISSKVPQLSDSSNGFSCYC